jgi:hypothetical protein
MYLMISLQQPNTWLLKIHLFTIPSHSWWVKRRFVVGATMTQRPELMKSLCRQWAWWTCCVTTPLPQEQGVWLRNDSKEMFSYIKAIPVHNVKQGVQYPATMVTTAITMIE